MVDIVHHGIIGLAGALTAQQLGHPDVAAGFLIGSVLPDIDALLMVFGKSRFLKWHQAATHSIFALPILSACFALLLSGTYGASFLAVLLSCFAGSVVHVLLDAMNTFGVRAFWPFAPRIALDVIFFIDLPLLIGSGTALCAILTGGTAVPVLSSWLVLTGLYLAFKKAWHHAVLDASHADFAIPSGIFPFTYFLTRLTEGGTQAGTCRGFNCSVRWEPPLATVTDSLVAIARAGPIYRDLEEALRCFRTISVDETDGVQVVVSRCVAVRNFRNRYGELVTTVSDGKVIDETARL
jgi:membrane-bound metal-dependent hydrolase YbcI (DUF457 family)